MAMEHALLPPASGASAVHLAPWRRGAATASTAVDASCPARGSGETALPSASVHGSRAATSRPSGPGSETSVELNAMRHQLLALVRSTTSAHVHFGGIRHAKEPLGGDAQRPEGHVMHTLLPAMLAVPAAHTAQRVTPT